MPPRDSAAHFVLQTPTGPVVVPSLALAIIVGVLLGLLIALWTMHRRRAAAHAAATAPPSEPPAALGSSRH